MGKKDPGLTRLSLTDRQWNRQQAIFDVDNPKLEITGGDGVEKNQSVSAELAKNCLNASLWEVLLYITIQQKMVAFRLKQLPNS